MSEETLRQIIDLQDRLIVLLGYYLCGHYESPSQEEIHLRTQLSELKDNMNKND